MLLICALRPRLCVVFSSQPLGCALCSSSLASKALLVAHGFVLLSETFGGHRLVWDMLGCAPREKQLCHLALLGCVPSQAVECVHILATCV